MLSAQEQNQKLKTSNQSLNGRLEKLKTKKKEATKETQTEKPSTRHIMVGTSPVAVAD